MHQINKNSLSYVLLFLLGLIWGSSFLFIKFTVISLEPITAVLLRMTIAASCLFVYLKIQKIPNAEQKTKSTNEKKYKIKAV